MIVGYEFKSKIERKCWLCEKDISIGDLVNKFHDELISECQGKRFEDSPIVICYKCSNKATLVQKVKEKVMVSI